jgi:hypothetical protein
MTSAMAQRAQGRRADDFSVFCWRAEAPERAAVLSEGHATTSAEIYLPMINKESHLLRQPIRIGDIVGIHSGQVRATCPVDTFIQSGRHAQPPSIAPAKHTRAVEAVRNGQTLIVRTVVAE